MRKLIFLFAGLLVPAMLMAELEQVWVAEHGTGSCNGAQVMHVDAADNVYVTGYDLDAQWNNDWLTVKYDACGVQLWDAVYDGGANDIACGLGVDASGDVYVVGSSSGYSTTVKYCGADGQQLASAQFGNGTSDAAYAIALDGSGNVYVLASSGFSYIAIVKYNPSLVQQWRIEECGDARGIAVDVAGDVYVTGAWGFGTEKYDGHDGEPMWSQRGTVGGDRVVLDGLGGVYVSGSAGNGFRTTKYRGSDGQLLWDETFTRGYGELAYGLTADALGDVYVTGASMNGDGNYDYATIKLAGSDGRQLWLQPAIYDNDGDFDCAYGISLDASGTAYVTGIGYDLGEENSDYVTIGYSCADGCQSWLRKYDGPGYGCDEAHAISVDMDGSVYVTGASSQPGDEWSFGTIKYGVPGVADVGTVSIEYPYGVVDTLAETPQAVVHNFGTSTASFDAWYEIRDSATNTLQYRRSVSVTDLEADGDYAAVFPDWNVPNDREGRYYCSAWTALEGDVNVHNDTARSQFAVEAKQQGPPAWTQWTDVPTGPKNRVVQHGAALATDPLGLYAYLLKGDNTGEFYRFDPATATWLPLDEVPELGRDNVPRTVKDGGTLAQVNGKFYATKGGNCLEFWEYDPAALPGHRWTQKADVPAGAAGVQNGASAAGVGVGMQGYVYLLKASGTFEFYRYDVTNDCWQTMANAPGLAGQEFKDGSSISFDGADTIFTLKGMLNKFYVYVVSTNTWLDRPDLPLGPKNKQAKGGAAICYHLRNVYCIKGSNSQEFWVYDCNAGVWDQGSDVTLGPRKTRVQDGGALVYCCASRYLFATKGNCLELWSYGRLSNYSGAMSPDREPVGLSDRIAPYRLEVSPTVVAGQARIVYALPRAGNVELALYDAAGRLAKTLVHGTGEPGAHVVSLEASVLESGVYIIRYRSGEYQTARKLVVE